jgi:hypothetical protein
MENNDLETQLAAACGYSAWLTAILPHQTGANKDFIDSLLHVLDVYAHEIERQLQGVKATNDWLGLLDLTRMTAKFLRDEMVEDNPALLTYSPLNDPTIEEMPIRMLRDAVVVFDTALAGQHKPHFIVRVANFVQRVLRIK